MGACQSSATLPAKVPLLQRSGDYVTWRAAPNKYTSKWLRRMRDESYQSSLLVTNACSILGLADFYQLLLDGCHLPIEALYHCIRREEVTHLWQITFHKSNPFIPTPGLNSAEEAQTKLALFLRWFLHHYPDETRQGLIAFFSDTMPPGPSADGWFKSSLLSILVKLDFFDNLHLSDELFHRILGRYSVVPKLMALHVKYPNRALPTITRTTEEAKEIRRYYSISLVGKNRREKSRLLASTLYELITIGCGVVNAAAAAEMMLGANYRISNLPNSKLHPLIALSLKYGDYGVLQDLTAAQIGYFAFRIVESKQGRCRNRNSPPNVQEILSTFASRHVLLEMRLWAKHLLLASHFTFILTTPSRRKKKKGHARYVR